MRKRKNWTFNNTVKSIALVISVLVLVLSYLNPEFVNSLTESSGGHFVAGADKDAYRTVNNGVPDFSEEDISEESFIRLSELDPYGRCGPAMACLGLDTLAAKEREDIGFVKPSGWHTVKYPGIIEDLYLYNRCHLIGYQLSGINADERNLITGTRHLNVTGMLPFENAVAKYIRSSGNHVMYRVIPDFVGNEMVSRGVYMEGWSVEDRGKGISFSVYCYNTQPGIEINYANGDSTEVQ